MTPSRRRMTPLRRRMIDDMPLRNLSPKTIESYAQRITGFAAYFKTAPEQLGPDQPSLARASPGSRDRIAGRVGS